MLQIFNTVEDGLKELDQVTEGCWVALTKPTMEELETVSTTTGIDIHDLRAPLDDEERSRVEIENDYVVILVDIPSLDEKDRYVTIPLGIYTTDKIIVTVCLEETPVLKAFMNNREREFYTFKKTRFVFQILYRNATSYLRYLRIIDRKSEQIEEKLHISQRNKELIELLEPEKVAEEVSKAAEEKEVISSESAPSAQEEKKVYITDGKQSLGEVLMAHETSWEEFVRLNNLDQVALQEDQILYFTK